eukprot:CAMPEP_0176328962 /NCGR_PEP_ID=MMETSP0121_2-20121125/75233_1 /TAXON_ID=160619 /ORGANISM="Kryptoperidinium foliaceum, Strain CCMP 1326" /LENGTH=370 /DNA_ID=CAMNT_0017671649 /DNA_START=1 /DNA_END=1114 /DNA_ORIENTATION=-
MAKNYRRVVVPVTADLDVTHWRQRDGNYRQEKGYLTWDADFKPLVSDGFEVPVISGGLLVSAGGGGRRLEATAAAQWASAARSWTSPSWLCGGEIVVAEDARIAHMRREDSDPRTKANYDMPQGIVMANRLRIATAWFGEFAEKLKEFPMLGSDRKASGGGLAHGDVESILDVKRRLNCRPFAWFLHRFRSVYEAGGLLPSETFHLKSSISGRCLAYAGQVGSSPDGKGIAELRPCDAKDERQRWHGANRDVEQAEQLCCSGLRVWNTDQCLRGADGNAAGRGHARTAACDISGRDPSQAWSLDGEGHLRKRGASGFLSSSCLEADEKGSLKVLLCPRRGAAPSAWTREWASEPMETRLYRQALENGVAG